MSWVVRWEGRPTSPGASTTKDMMSKQQADRRVQAAQCSRQVSQQRLTKLHSPHGPHQIEEARAHQREEGDGNALLARSPGTADAMRVRLNGVGHVVVDDLRSRAGGGGRGQGTQHRGPEGG